MILYLTVGSSGLLYVTVTVLLIRCGLCANLNSTEMVSAWPGIIGSLGQPVISDVSIATDKSIFPRAALCYVVTYEGQGPRARPYAAFRLDHDTGGAIRAPGRCDLYMGEGPQAERRAGMQRSPGRLYYLVARE